LQALSAAKCKLHQLLTLLACLAGKALGSLIGGTAEGFVYNNMLIADSTSSTGGDRADNLAQVIRLFLIVTG
jgi:hypothetical protein